ATNRSTARCSCSTVSCRSPAGATAAAHCANSARSAARARRCSSPPTTATTRRPSARCGGWKPCAGFRANRIRGWSSSATATSRTTSGGPSCTCPTARKSSPTSRPPAGSTSRTPCVASWAKSPAACASFPTNAVSGPPAPALALRRGPAQRDRPIMFDFTDRTWLWLAAAAYFGGFVLGTVALLRDRRHSRGWMYAIIILGYLLQTAGLYLRGLEVKGCPVGNTFEIFQFTAWSAITLYLVIGPAFRLSLLGYFTCMLTTTLTLVSLAI